MQIDGRTRFQAVLVPITGFTEGWARPTGIEAIWDAAPVPDGAWVIDPQRWCADFGSLAKLIVRHTLPDARVVLVAHSWGVGWGARKLAERLEELGIGVWALVSADGVYRVPWMPPAIPVNPLSIVPWSWWRPKIPLPANVRAVVAFRQLHGLARGHLFRPAPGTTLEYLDLEVPHGATDEHPAFRLRALDVWREASST